jgi:hypothetical protein
MTAFVAQPLVVRSASNTVLSYFLRSLRNPRGHDRVQASLQRTIGGGTTMNEEGLSLIVPSELWDYENGTNAPLLNKDVLAWCDENINPAAQFVETTDTERYAKDLLALEETLCEDCADIVCVYLWNFGVDGPFPVLLATFVNITDYTMFKLRWS